ncbi:MAG: hypothetical protein IJ200_00025 [Prevotella sp.]|nr:hypothetical protein [Prevotella sp.]
MKVANFIEMNRELLIFLRENGIKLDYAELTEMYHYYKSERQKPGSKHEEILRDIHRIYGIGKTKAWEVIKLLDKDV